MSTTPSAFAPLPEAEKLRRLLGSPLRVALVSFMRRERDERFDLDSLSRRTGRLRGDVEGCLKALVDMQLLEGHAAGSWDPPNSFGGREAGRVSPE